LPTVTSAVAAAQTNFAAELAGAVAVDVADRAGPRRRGRGAVVTLLAAHDHGVAALGGASRDALLKPPSVSTKLEAFVCRSAWNSAISYKATHLQLMRYRLRRKIERDGARRLRVQATQVDRQVAVDEHPHVVVAREVEQLAAVVLEPELELAGEAEVVASRRILFGGSASGEADAVEREERVVLM